jgi:hypothetical protein
MKEDNLSHFVPFITITNTIIHGETIYNLDINNEFLKYLKTYERVKFVTFAGELNAQTDTMANTLPYFYNLPSDYEGLLPNRFDDKFKDDGFYILPEAIKLSTDITEPIFLIYGRNIKKRIVDLVENEKNLFTKCLDKLYFLFMIISDAFIFNLDETREVVDDQGKNHNSLLIKKFKYICNYIEKKRSGKRSIQEINIDNLYIFKTSNNKGINVDLEVSRLGGVNIEKEVEKWIFPIAEVPIDFRKEAFTKFINKSDFERDIRKAMEVIVPDIAEKHRFHLDRIEMYVNILNNFQRAEFGDIIELDMHLEAIENLKNEKMKGLADFSSIINEINFSFYEYEITEDMSNTYIEEQLKQHPKIKNFNKVLEENNIDIQYKDSIQKGEVQKRQKISVKKIKKTQDKIDLIPQDLDEETSTTTKSGTASSTKGNNAPDFSKKTINSVEDVISKTGEKGNVITLDDGERYLVHETESGTKITESMGISEDWRPVANSKKSTNVQVKDYFKDKEIINPKEDDLQGTKTALEEETPNKLGLTGQLGLSTVAVGSAIFGAVIANILTGQYKRESWYHIKKDIMLSGGISIAISTIATKIPWLGLAVVGGYFGVDSAKLLMNKELTTESKEELIAKSVFQLAVGVGVGSGCSYLGATIGSLIPGIGTTLGAVSGLIIGSLTGGFAATYVGNEINNLWKILVPQEVLDILKEYNLENGSWISIDIICTRLRMDKTFLIEHRPEGLDNITFTHKDIAWSNFVFFNIVTIIASINTELEEQSKELYIKSVKFLKNNDDKIYYYKFLPNVKDVLDNWISLIK